MGMKMKVGLSVAKGVARRPIRTPVFHQLEAIDIHRDMKRASHAFEGASEHVQSKVKEKLKEIKFTKFRHLQG